MSHVVGAFVTTEAATLGVFGIGVADFVLSPLADPVACRTLGISGGAKRLSWNAFGRPFLPSVLSATERHANKRLPKWFYPQAGKKSGMVQQLPREREDRETPK
jgi:hypothetical protein